MKRSTVKVLNQYPEFVEFHSSKQNDKTMSTPSNEQDISETPEETLQKAYQGIRNDLKIEILDNIKTNTPEFFEKLVVDLMVGMGYGGSRSDAGKSVGRSGDEGIDGIIKEDRLGLDVIYLQAKRWEGTVGRPEIQKFVGALHGKKGKERGSLLRLVLSQAGPTITFKTIDPKVILIDGHGLAGYMIDFNIGASTQATYEVKRIDTDYFVED